MSTNVLLKNNYDSISLDDWIKEHHSEDELREVFLNLDRALKYIHEHGYCIEVFYPTEIMVLNNETDHIQFNKLLELSSNEEMKRQMIKEDIFNSSLVQIGLYSNSLRYLTPEFLKENFDAFAQFLPTGDIPYYRGVVQRGASVYFCEFALEKRNRDLEELEKQLGEDGDKNKELWKSKIPQTSITNDRVNDTIYKQINGLKDSAFIHFLILPTIVLGMLLVFSIITWIVSLFA